MIKFFKSVTPFWGVGRQALFSLLEMFSRSNLEVTKNRVHLKSGTLSRWPTNLSKDLMNTAFTRFSGKSPTVTEAPNSDPVVSKEHRQVRWLHPECCDTSHWAELPYASPASRVLLGQPREVSPQVSPLRPWSGSERPVLSCRRAEDAQALSPGSHRDHRNLVRPSQDWVCVTY